MITPYLILGLKPPDADSDDAAYDRQVRARYLELVRQHPPALAPERFAQTVRAYEQVATARQRSRNALVGALDHPTVEAGLDALAAAVGLAQSGPTLAALLDACGVHHV